MPPVSDDRLSISLLTREYPPSIYGGAGVHVAQLVPQLRKLIDVDVQCMGEPREGATAHAENYPAGRERGPAGLRRGPVHGRRRPRGRPGAFPHLVRQPGRASDRAAARHPARGQRPLPRAAPSVEGRAVGRRLPALVLGGTDRLRRRRRGDRGQRGDAYRRPWSPTPTSTRTRCTWSRTASTPTSSLPTPAPTSSTDLGMDPDQPSVVFVGRITRQKGLIHLVRAAEQLDPGTQVVLLAGAPDTPEIAQEFDDAFAHLQSSRGNVLWVQEMLPRASRPPGAVPRHRVRLPVGLRAAGHREPGGHGLRDRRGRLGRGRHPRGRGRRRDRIPGALRPGPGRRPGRHRRVRGRIWRPRSTH